MEALIMCSLCRSFPASGTWNYQNVGGINKPVCHDCNKDLQAYAAKPFFEQLDVIDELLAEANKEIAADMEAHVHVEVLDNLKGLQVLNNESLNQEAAQPTTPSNDGESKATNE